MTFAFTAKSVECTDAIGGDILQVAFDSMEERDDEDDQETPYVCISQNFEFPGPARIEWHDGSDGDGGSDIVSIVLTPDRALIKLDRGLEIDVSFSIGDTRFAQLSTHLRKILPENIVTNM